MSDRMASITRDDDAGTMIINLDPPVSFRGGELVEISLREPTVKQVREAEKEYSGDAPWSATTAYEMNLIGQVAKIKEQAALDALPIGVVNVAAAFLAEFVDEGKPADGDDPIEEPVPTADECSLTINPPLKFLATEYHELLMREPLASELRKSRSLARGVGSIFEMRRAGIMLVSAVSGLPQPVIEALPIRVFHRATRLCNRFTRAGRKTGKR